MVATAQKIETPIYRKRKFTRDEYYQIAEIGLFQGQHVELIEGEVLCMFAMGVQHYTAVLLTGETLRQAFGEGYVVRMQGPLTLTAMTELEPDIAVVPGTPRDYANAPTHPNTALLIVEVADTSLQYDRAIKASLYACAGIPDYWVLNLVERRLEVFREPDEMPKQPYGAGYRSVRVYSEQEEVSLLEKPHVKIKVADLLP